MLPTGAVHLTDYQLTVHIPHAAQQLRQIRLPSLKRLAKQIEVDYADAVVGFEYHGGRSVPTIDGIVVAAEHEITLRDMYLDQLFETLKKEAAAREKEIVKRWELLVKKVVLAEELKRKFGDDGEQRNGGKRVKM
jgi:xeroderma pigmentosum group C-complementing protein